MGDLENAAQRINLAAEKLSYSLGPLGTIGDDINNAHLGGLSMVLTNLNDAKAQLQEAGGNAADQMLAQLGALESSVTTLQQVMQQAASDADTVKATMAQASADLVELAQRVQASAV